MNRAEAKAFSKGSWRSSAHRQCQPLVRKLSPIAGPSTSLNWTHSILNKVAWSAGVPRERYRQHRMHPTTGWSCFSCLLPPTD